MQKIIAISILWFVFSSACFDSSYNALNSGSSDASYGANEPLPAGSLQINQLAGEVSSELGAALRKMGLTSDQADIVVESAQNEIKTGVLALPNLALSEDKSAIEFIMPFIVQGAVKSLKDPDINIALVGDKIAVVDTIVKSTFNSLSGRTSEIEAEKKIALGNVMVSKAVSNLENAAIKDSDTAEGAKKIAEGAVASITALDFTGQNIVLAAKAIVSGAIASLPISVEQKPYLASNVNRTCFGATSSISLVVPSTSESITAVGDLAKASVFGLKGLDIANEQVSTLVQQVSSGTVSAFGTVGLIGAGFGAALQEVTKASVTAVAENSFSAEAVKSSAGAVAGGAVSALTAAGISSQDIAGSDFVAKIMTSAMSGLSSSGISGKDVAATMGSIVGQTVASLGGIDSTELKKSVINNVISGVMSSFKASGIGDISTVNVAMQNLSKGAASSLADAGILAQDISSVAATITQTSIANAANIGISSADDFKNIIGNVTQGMVQGMSALRDSSAIVADSFADTVSLVTSGALSAIDSLKTQGQISSSDLGSLSAAVASSAVNGLAFSGVSLSEIESLQTSLSSSMTSKLSEIGVDDLDSLSNSLSEAFSTAKETARTISSGDARKCQSDFPDAMSDTDFVSAISGNIVCQLSDSAICPKSRTISSIDYAWIEQSGLVHICQLQKTVQKDVDSPPLPVPVLTMKASVQNVTSQNFRNFAISGSCLNIEDNQAIALKISGISILLTPIICKQEIWSGIVDLSKAKEGLLRITADAANSAGVQAGQVAISVTKDTQGPLLTITTPTLPFNSTSKGVYPLAGTCSLDGENSIISLFSKEAAIKTKSEVKCSKGVWAAIADLSNLNGSNFEITATIPDSLQNIGLATLKMEGPSITQLADLSINEDSLGSISFVLFASDSKLNCTTSVTFASTNPNLLTNATFSGNFPNCMLQVTPFANMNGSAVITLEVTDGVFSTQKNFNLTVLAVNDAPTISSFSTLTINEDSSSGNIPFVISDIDSTLNCATSLSFSSANTALVANSSASFSGTAPNCFLNFAPQINANGSTVLTVKVSDGALSAQRDFTLNVNPVNDAPVITTLSDLTINEDSYSNISFQISDVDSILFCGSSVSFSSTNQCLVANGNASFSGVAPNCVLQFSPLSDASGTSNITVSVSDGFITAQTGFVLTVDPVNDAPTIINVPDQITNANTSTTISFTVGDIDTPIASLTMSGTSSDTTIVPNSNIIFSGTGQNKTAFITPASGQTGIVAITLEVSDGTSSASTTFDLTINSPALPDPVMEFNAQDISGNDGDDIRIWYDSIAHKSASAQNQTATYTPTLKLNAINGENAVLFAGSPQTFIVSAADSPMSNSSAFTIAIVFKPNSSGVGSSSQWYQNTGLVDAEQGGSVYDWGLCIDGSYKIAAGIGLTDQTLYSAATDNTSAHIAFYTWSSDDQIQVLNVDGIKSTLTTSSNNVRNSYRFVIGSMNQSNYFYGLIANIKIFNTALSDTEISILGTILAQTYGLNINY